MIGRRFRDTHDFSVKQFKVEQPLKLKIKVKGFTVKGGFESSCKGGCWTQATLDFVASREFQISDLVNSFDSTMLGFCCTKSEMCL